MVWTIWLWGGHVTCPFVDEWYACHVWWNIMLMLVLYVAEGTTFQRCLIWVVCNIYMYICTVLYCTVRKGSLKGKKYTHWPSCLGIFMTKHSFLGTSLYENPLANIIIFISFYHISFFFFLFSSVLLTYSIITSSFFHSLHTSLLLHTVHIL